MHLSDFPQFQALLASVAQVYSKKITDELVQAYWEALKDRALISVRQFTEEHVRRHKFFPKPVELRPKDEKPTNPDGEAAMRALDDDVIRKLEKSRQENPQGWLEQMTAAKGPDCNAIRLHRQFGDRLWYDLKERCWRV